MKKWISYLLILAQFAQLSAFAAPKTRFQNDVVVGGNTTLSGTLGVTGAATLSSTLGTSGLATLNSCSVTNNATVGGTLGVTGASTLASLGVTNACTVGTTLGVTGATTLSSTLAVTGATSILGATAIGTSSAADSKAILDVVSTTKGILPPRMTTTQRDAISSPTTGLLIYNTTTNKVNSYNGTSWSEVGSGTTGSGINYISANNGNSDAETGTTGWSTYANTAQNIPVSATGGSPVSTWTRTTSTPLRGVGSFLWTRTAVNRQGEGVSYAFTIDSADQAKPLAITFDYINASGTFFAADGITAPSNDGTTTQNAGNSDLEVFVYDVTNAALIPVSPQVLTCSSSSIPCTFKGVFQTASNSTSYRLAIHTARSTAVAFTEKFDNFFVGPQSVSYGAPISDWTAYTPTISAGFGTTSSVSFFYRREGDFLRVRGTFTSGTVAASLGSISLPSGLSIDTTKIPISNITINPGPQVGMFWTNVTNQLGAIVTATGTSTTVVYTGAQVTSSAESTPTNASAVFNGSQFMTVEFSVPITGWASGVIFSNDTDTRVVAATVTAPTATITGAPSDITWTVSDDTHSAFSGSTYTIPVSGRYEVTGHLLVSATFTAGQIVHIGILKNGSVVKNNQIYAGASVGTVSIPVQSGEISCVAGDTIKLQVDSSGTSPTFISNNPYQFVSFKRLSGPSAIAATETVSARYKTSAGQSMPNAATTIVNFDTKDWDDHSATVVGASWKFTAPVSGKYQISSTVKIASVGTGNYLELYVFKNGSNAGTLGSQYVTTASINTTVNGTNDVNLVAGDFIDVRLFQQGGGSASLNANANDVWVTVKRVGN